jgi:hypothetical protein
VDIIGTMSVPGEREAGGQVAEPNGTDTAFRWSEKAHRAAVLVAEDELSDIDIAAAVGIGRTTLHRWKLNKDFTAQVGDYVGDINRAMLRLAIAKKRKRLSVLDDLHTKALNVIAARSEDESVAEFAGGNTGLLVRQIKVVGTGPMAREVEEAAVDVGLIREIRALEEQAAKELGQWVEKSEVGGMVQVVRVIGADVEAI